jgi:TPR repeat protein
MKIQNIILAAVALCTLLCPILAQAETLDDLIQQARKSGDWSAVEQQIEVRANTGDPAALTALSQMQLQGLGTTQDTQKSLVTLRKAADQNYPLAQSYLGFYYAVGVGMPKDLKLAAEWYQKAATQGVSEAQYNLGLMNGNGELGVVDEKKSLALYQQAADQGFPKAWLNLGVTYLQGNDTVPKDFVKARDFFKKAADSGETAAQYNLGLIYLRGDTGVTNIGLAYYYLSLANNPDPRGVCVPASLWVVANLETDHAMSQELVIRQTLARQSCMVPHPQAQRLLDSMDKVAEKYPDLQTLLPKVHAAVAAFLEHRRLLDAPISEQAAAAVKSKKYEGEYSGLLSPPYWQIVKMMEHHGDTTLTEMRPPDQTGEDWSKSVQYEQTPKLHYDKPAQRIEPLLAQLHKQCKEVQENKTFAGIENGFPTYVGSAFCTGTDNPKFNAENHFYKAVQGVDSFYFWHIIWRGDKDAMLGDKDTYLKTVLEFATLLKKQVVCDLRVKQGEKSCPAGMPGT